MHKGTFIGENKQSKDNAPRIQPVSTQMQQILFGVTFSCPQNKLTFFQQHLYSLFLLLYYYGEQEHKKVIKQKIQKVIKDIKPKLLELSTRKLSNQSLNSKSENMDSMLVQVQIKALEFTKHELDKTVIGNKLQLHSKSQRQLIRKAFAFICQDNYHLIQKIQMSFFGISKIAGLLLNIQYKVQNYYGCSIINFLSNVFIQKGIIVYIEINKEKETYSYIKQKTLNKQISNQKNKFQSNNSFMQRLMESSFHMLLKQQISIQYSNNSLFDDQEASSQYYDQSAVAQDNNQKYLEQSLVLQDVNLNSFKKKPSQQQVTSKIKQKQAAVIIQQEPQINKRQHYESEQASIMKHDENIDKNTSLSRKQNTKYSQNQFKNSLQIIFGKVPVRFSGNQKQNETKFDKQQIQSVQSENNCAKSAKIISPKIQKKRKSSETFQQTNRFDDYIDLQQFIRCISEENFQIQNSSISQVGQEINMFESVTLPIKYNDEGIPILQNQQSYQPQNVATIVKTVKSNTYYSQTQLFSKFSLQQVIEAIDQLQNYLKPQKQSQKQNLNPENLQDGSPDTVNILIGIMKQQKQQYIWKFIEEARLRINSLKNNTAFLQPQIPNQIIKQENININKSKNISPLRRGEETIMFFQQQYTMQKNNTFLFSKILSKKGLDILDAKQIKRQQNLKDLSKLLNISNHPYTMQLNLKASKCFSLDMNMNTRN